MTIGTSTYTLRGINRSGTSDNIVKFVESDITPKNIIPTGFMSVDRLVESFSRDIPDGEELLINARKDIANVFYEGINTFTSIRLRSGLSQRKLSKLVGTSQAHISKIEHGKNDPTLSTLRKLAAALGVSIEELDAAMPS